MFLDGHHLDGIISRFFYPRQNILREFNVGTQPLFFLRHTDMAFIDI